MSPRAAHLRARVYRLRTLTTGAVYLRLVPRARVLISTPEAASDGIHYLVRRLSMVWPGGRWLLEVLQ